MVHRRSSEMLAWCRRMGSVRGKEDEEEEETEEGRWEGENGE